MENSSRFFKNTSCSYFPCHKGIDCEEFNCLFCYCPFYSWSVCPGNPSFIKKEDGRIIKKCTDCIFPHKSENYDKIINLLKSQKKEALPKEFHHGNEAPSCEDEKICQNQCISFAVNTNPLGLPEGVKAVLKENISAFESYPDQTSAPLKKALKKKYPCIREGEIVFGNGASELISLTVQALSPKKALIVSPTFSGYERALSPSSCKIFRHFLKREEDFILNDGLFSSIERASSDGLMPEIIFICSPNNPTGKMADFSFLKRLLSFCEEKGIFLFLDQSFIDFTQKSKESAIQLVRENPRLIVLEAFTKIYAMAGIRLGYIVSSNPSLIEKINSCRPEWNVSTVAQLAGEQALKEDEYIEKTRSLVAKERDFLVKELKALGYSVYPGEANFILFHSMSENLYTFMLKEGIILRKCGDFPGLFQTDYRMAVKNHEKNLRFIEVLKKFPGENFKEKEM